jgi:transmembrane sensor
MTNPTENPLSHDELAMAQAAAWLARLGGSVAGEDGVEFDAWLEAAPQNRAAYRRAVLLWQEFDARAGDVLAELAPRGRQAPVRPFAARRASRLLWLAPAGGFALAAGLALAVLPPLMVPTTVTAYATGKGEHRHIALADGSAIDLDAETQVRVTLSRSERRVTLGDGQAIFDVAHDARRPFVVAAAGRIVRDLGTQFDVKARGGQLTVTVARGRVEVVSVSSAAPERAIALAPGQRLAIDGAGVGQLSRVDPAETSSWRAGRLVYRAQPLAEVVADLNRQFVEQTEIADPELGKLPITGVVVLDNPRAVVARLSLMLPIKAIPSDKALILLRR